MFSRYTWETHVQLLLHTRTHAVADTLPECVKKYIITPGYSDFFKELRCSRTTYSVFIVHNSGAKISKVGYLLHVMWLRSLIRVLKNNETIRLTNHDDSSISTFWEVFRDRVHDIICSGGCRVAGPLTAERRYTNSLRVQTDSLTVLDFWYHLVEHLMQGTLYANIGRYKLLICTWSETIFEIRFKVLIAIANYYQT